MIYRILITPLLSFGHRVVCSSMIYRFWLQPCYLLVIVLSVLLWYTDSDYPLGIFWQLCCLFFYDIQILITPLVSFGHCVVCFSMIYRFWLHPWYLSAIVLSVLLWFTDFDFLLGIFGNCVFCSSMIYGFWLSLGIFWTLCCLFFYDLHILITPLVSFCHCVVFSFMIYRFWLHPWYLLAILLSVLLWYTDSDYTLGIFWPLCCLFFYNIQILITPLVSFGHCVFCSSMIYRFWLPSWYLSAIVLSVLLWFTILIISLGIFWQFCCLFFYDLRILITPWYLLAIVLSVLLWFTDSYYPLGIFWPLCCLFFYDIQILNTPWYLLAIVLSVLWYTDSDYPLVSFGHCVVCSMIYRILITPLLSFGHRVVCSSMIYRFWLQPWYILVIVLSVLLWNTDSDYPLGIFWPLCCLFLYDIQILITPLVSFGHWVVCSSMIYGFWFPPWYLLAIVFSVLLWFTYSDYPLVSFGHFVVCSSMIYTFWLHPWYLLAIVLSFLLWFTDCDYTLGIFWPFCCLFFYDIQILITPLVSFGHWVVCSSMIYRFCLSPWYLLAIVLSFLLWFTGSDYPLVSFGHCVVCSSMIYRFWLSPWNLLGIVLSFLLWFTDSDYTLGIFWSLCCLFFYEIQILITPLVSFGHCVVCSSMKYILITPLVYFGHCVVCSSMIYRFWLHPGYLLAICSSMIYRFWLHLWYLLAIVLSVLLWFRDSDYPLGIFWPLCCLFFYGLRILITPLVSFGHLFFYDIQILITSLVSFGHLFFYDIQILITPLVSFGHCVVCFSMIYRFWLHPWYLSAIGLSVLLWFTDSDFPLGIFWQLCFLFFYDLRILIIAWYLLDIVLFVLLWSTHSDYTLDIFWPLCCLFFYDLQILITPGIFWPLCCLFFYDIQILITPWYLLAIVLSVLLWYTDSDYPLGIFWPLCCLFFYDMQILITPWYHLVIVLCILLWNTDSDYTLGII